jgi:hypothetical protein
MKAVKTFIDVSHRSCGNKQTNDCNVNDGDLYQNPIFGIKVTNYFTLPHFYSDISNKAGCITVAGSL